jgi:hypothetical protein
VQPEMMADNNSGVTEELPALLIYVPIKKQKTFKAISKKQVLKIIDFLHKNIYHDLTDKSIDEHANYLNKLYLNYEKTLPEKIELLLN